MVIKEKRNRRMSVLAVMLSLILAVNAGCASKAAKADESKLKVVTTMFAAYDFAKQLGGDAAEVSMLLKPGSEAHTFEPTPQDIKSIGSCDVFICVGGENDVWVDSILDSIDNKNMTVIRMIESTQVLEEELVEGMQQEDEEEEEEGEIEWDEHVWMSPINAGMICDTIASVFASKDPANSDAYNNRLGEYKDQLDRLDEQFREIVDTAQRKEVVFADRFPARYFTEEYGLCYYAAFPGCSEDSEASAATVSFLIDKVKEDGIPVIFTIELSNGKLASVVSEDTGAKVMTFYTAHNVTSDDFNAGVSYMDLMNRNLETLKEALN